MTFNISLKLVIIYPLNRLCFQAPTTTAKTTAKPVAEEPENYDENLEGRQDEVSEAPVSTTASPKKKANPGSVRPILRY